MGKEHRFVLSNVLFPILRHLLIIMATGLWLMQNQADSG